MNFEWGLVDFTYTFGKSNLSQMMKLANGSVVALYCIFCYTGTGNINSSHPSAAYIPQWIGSTLVQIMACRLFGTNWTLGNRIRSNLNQNTKFFIHENAFENVVCELAAIFFRGVVEVETKWLPYLGGKVIFFTGIFSQWSTSHWRLYIHYSASISQEWGWNMNIKNSDLLPIKSNWSMG